VTTSDQYRKRAEKLGAGLQQRTAAERVPVIKKQKALTDMADNEDWLNGKIKAKPNPASGLDCGQVSVRRRPTGQSAG
jgi:hypothetical protein